MSAIGFGLSNPAQSRSSQHDAAEQQLKGNKAEPAQQYVVESAWNVCGAILYGWEGCHSQTGAAFRCADGSRVYLVVEHCTSSRAASDLRLSRLAGTETNNQAWEIAQSIPLGNALLVELAKPADIGQDSSVSLRWVCLWTEDGTLKLVYGADREHVVGYFQTLKT